MTKEIIIEDKDEFDKLTNMGTTYHRDDRMVVATTVGLSEGADTETLEKHRVDFVYETI